MTTLVLATQPLEPINELYVFGDSLSDVGTVFRATSGLYPPSSTYFQGRYSNGRVWVEYLADRLQIATNRTHNFAIGGATTEANSINLAPGLLTQVETFSRTYTQPHPQALYVLWAGANDYLQGTSSATQPIENVTQAISILEKNGAKRILVANLPDLGQLPATRTSTNASRLSTLTEAHNQGLRRSLKQLSQQGSSLKIITLDAQHLYHEAVTRPATFGFTNTTNACLSDSRSCGNPDQFLFWDGIHPTTAAHQILSDRAFAALEAEQLTGSHRTVAGS